MAPTPELPFRAGQQAGEPQDTVPEQGPRGAALFHLPANQRRTSRAPGEGNQRRASRAPGGANSTRRPCAQAPASWASTAPAGIACPASATSQRTLPTPSRDVRSTGRHSSCQRASRAPRAQPPVAARTLPFRAGRHAATCPRTRRRNSSPTARAGAARSPRLGKTPLLWCLLRAPARTGRCGPNAARRRQSLQRRRLSLLRAALSSARVPRAAPRLLGLQLPGRELQGRERHDRPGDLL